MEGMVNISVLPRPPPPPSPPRPHQINALSTASWRDQPIFKEQIIHFYYDKGEEGGALHCLCEASMNTDGKSQQKLFPKKKTKD